MLETITLADKSENPLWSICPGHVDNATFLAAWKAEGWDGNETDRPEDLELRHEWWVNRGETWKQSAEGVRGAQPVTVMDW